MCHLQFGGSQSRSTGRFTIKVMQDIMSLLYIPGHAMQAEAFCKIGTSIANSCSICASALGIVNLNLQLHDALHRLV